MLNLLNLSDTSFQIKYNAARVSNLEFSEVVQVKKNHTTQDPKQDLKIKEALSKVLPQ